MKKILFLFLLLPIFSYGQTPSLFEKRGDIIYELRAIASGDIEDLTQSQIDTLAKNGYLQIEKVVYKEPTLPEGIYKIIKQKQVTIYYFLRNSGTVEKNILPPEFLGNFLILKKINLLAFLGLFLIFILFSKTINIKGGKVRKIALLALISLVTFVFIALFTEVWLGMYNSVTVIYRSVIFLAFSLIINFLWKKLFNPPND